MVHGWPHLRRCSPPADAADLHAEAARPGRARMGCDRRRREGQGGESDGGSAERARRDGPEPRVDALGVESVAACGEKAELVLGAEGAEAD